MSVCPPLGLQLFLLTFVKNRHLIEEFSLVHIGDFKAIVSFKGLDLLSNVLVKDKYFLY